MRHPTLRMVWVKFWRAAPPAAEFNVILLDALYGCANRLSENPIIPKQKAKCETRIIIP
jgi:hypothetical protein